MVVLKACPPEYELLPLGTGDALEQTIQAHVDSCPACREAAQRLRAEVDALRQLLKGAAEGRPPGEPDKDAGNRAGAWAAYDEIPAAIGQYRVVGRIGQGGQAEVYRAVHPTLGNDVVIKLRRTVVPASQLRQDRLVAEGRLLAELAHPNLARVYDLGIHDGRPYLVMEFVRGQTLRQVAQQSKIPPREAARMVAKAARALAAAHARGVVHCDIRPENIILEESGSPRIIDFGMARLRDAWREASEPTGGTVAFMAPEQAEQFLAGGFSGDGTDRVDQRSDIFGLGAVLYAILAGHPPYRAPTLLETLELARRGAFDRSPLEKPGVPRALARICLRAMAVDPAQRYASASAMAVDLERFVHRPRTRALAGAAIAGLALLGLGLWPWLAPGPAPLPPAQQTLVEVLERGQTFTPRSPDELERYLPLHAGDRLVFRWDVPQGYQAAAFCLDSQGRLQELSPPSTNRVAAMLHARYPAMGSWPVTGPPGTILILVCARRHGSPRLEDVQALLGSGESWPPLPSDALLLMTRDEILPYGERPRGPEGPLMQVWNRLDRLRGQLGDRYEFFWGVALPQE